MTFPPFIGQPTIPAEASPAMAASLLSRFLDKIELSDGCWNWNSITNGIGYGVISVNRISKRLLAHRIAYEIWKGPIPEGLVLDHLCRNPSCVNPDHLEAVTFRENVLRGTSPSARQARQTHCKNGHPLEGDNVFWRGSHRRCVICTEAMSKEAWGKRTQEQRDRYNANRRRRYAERKTR